MDLENSTHPEEPLGAATWWKADRYELFEGTHIRPAPNAAIERYNVLEAFDEYLLGKGPSDSPYIRLQAVDLNSEQEVLDWCAEFGLLGVLHHRLVDVAFWPTWERRFSLRIEQLKPHQTILREGQGPDEFRTVTDFSDGPRSESDGSLESMPLERADVQRTWDPLRPPGATIRTDIGVQAATVVEAYGQFFPHMPGIPEWVQAECRLRLVPQRPGGDRTPPRAEDRPPLPDDLDKQSFPLPDGDDFHRLYAEPWYLFHDYARRFQLSKDDENYSEDFIAGDLPHLIGRANPRAQKAESSWRHSWTVPSLISAMSLLILQEHVLGNKRMPACATCGKRFVTTRPNKKHCSETHRKTAGMQRYREGLREREQQMLDKMERSE